MALFDKSSGLVYNETTSTQVRSMVPTWMTQARGRRDDPSRYRHRSPGCSTLQQMTFRSCIWHLDLMEPEALQWLGWHYASRIYEHLKTTDNFTFNAWSIFQKAFPNQIDRHHQFHVSEPDAWSDVPTQLSSMVNRMAKLDTSILTFLCIQNFCLATSDLIAFTQIQTLAALVLERKHNPMDRPTSVVNLNIWARAAYERRAFTKLRLLVVGDLGFDSDAISQAISRFPALTLVGVHQSGPFRDSYEGWHRASPRWLKGKISAPDERSPKSIWENPMTTKAYKIQLLTDLCNELLNQTPIEPASDLSISVFYHCNGRRAYDDSVAWFFRDPREETNQPTKRLTYQDRDDGKRGDINKKRKVRDVKKLDVGSLLNTFI